MKQIVTFEKRMLPQPFPPVLLLTKFPDRSDAGFVAGTATTSKSAG